MINTKHGEKRSRERLGLNKNSVPKNTEKAYTYGISQSDVKYGSLSKYLLSISSKNGEENDVRIYNRYVYIFSEDILITVYKLPNNFDTLADKLQKQKNSKNIKASEECLSSSMPICE